MKRIDYCGKTAIVTGASSGIGREIARILITKHGCTVYGVARGEDRLNSLLTELGNSFIPYPMDVSREQNWEKLRCELEKTDTRPDILINCAGVLPEFKSFSDTGTEELERVMEINFFSAVYACHHIMPIMNDGGAVGNVSSASALCPFGGVSSYTASKSALNSFSQSLSCERGRISVSSVMPGFVRTDIMKNQELSEKEEKAVRLFSAKAEKTAGRILSRLRKRKRRIVLGLDGHFMSVMYRLFPSLTPRLITRVLRASGMSLFKKI